MIGEARDPSGDEGPLSGLTVLDASRVLAGPFCGMQLGDLSADSALTRFTSLPESLTLLNC